MHELVAEKCSNHAKIEAIPKEDKQLISDLKQSNQKAAADCNKKLEQQLQSLKAIVSIFEYIK